MNTSQLLGVKIWGDLACFTCPEMKVERVSYEIITPSAARGVLEAIFWKPEFRWLVHEIHVLQPIEYISIVRNEVNSKISVRNTQSWVDEPTQGYFADDDRTQRHTLALRNVAYAIYADVELVGRGRDEHPAKYRDQFRRRVARGQCFHRPYLGCREFAAHFEEPVGNERPIRLTKNLGQMLFDIRYQQDRTGEGIPIFFNAELENGVMRIPKEFYAKTLNGAES